MNTTVSNFDEGHMFFLILYFVHWILVFIYANRYIVKGTTQWILLLDSCVMYKGICQTLSACILTI